MRGPDNICTAQDRLAWSDLVRAAQAVAAAPGHKGNAGWLAKASKHAASAVFPDPSEDGVKAFRTLHGFASTWRALSEADRRANAGPLHTAAMRCAEILGLEGAPPPPPTPAAPAVRAARLPYHDDSLDEDAA